MPYTNEKLEVYKQFLKGKTASVIGVGISNIPLIDFLLKNGVKVTARDKKSMEKLMENKNLDVERLKEAGVCFVTGEEYLADISEQIVYKSPGVRYDKPEIIKAYENGALITSEMEAFISLCPSKIIAVTGSNGKTTTTSVIAKILENAGKKVWLGGNIGKPLLSEIENISQSDFSVLELSSFQLHTINRFENKGLPFAKITFPDVAVITNISPNHLDWHEDMEEYAVSKKTIFSHMSDSGKVVINRKSDEYSLSFAFNAADNGLEVRTFSAYDDGAQGLNASYDTEKDAITVNNREVVKRRDIIVPGMHNVENYMAAILATYDFVQNESVVKTAKEFSGVAHRMEFVTKKNGVCFYNGSIDSSPSRTLAALSCFGKEYDGRINIILGGYDKQIPFDELAEPICERKIRAFITGATADKIYQAIQSSEIYKQKGAFLVRCDNFENAVRQASEAAVPGDVVLLSPACASFDEFDNFEKRGEKFKELVKEITG